MGFLFDESIGFVINRTARKYKQFLTDEFKKNGFDVTPDHWAILNRLWEEDGKTQKELSQSLFKDMTNVSRILDGLEKRNLIIRQANKEDRRSFKIYLTEKGNNMKGQLIPIAEKVLSKSLQGFDEDTILFLIRKLNQLYFNLEKE